MKEIDNISLQAKSSSLQMFWNLWCRFYPLAITDFAMTLGDMLRPVALSRLPSAEISLAAMGIIKSIAVFLESPIIMILHASTVLSTNKSAHRALWRFTLLASLILSSIFLACFFQPIYNWLFIDIFGAQSEIAVAARFSFMLMVPWPALIAIRRFYQGILVRDRQEKAMAIAGAMRLLFTVVLLWIGTFLLLNGTLVAALSLIGAVAIEAIMVLYFYYKNSAKSFSFSNDEIMLPKNLMEITRFYTPLATTSMVVWGARALMLGVVARSSTGISGVAIWTASMGFVLPLANSTRMIQQIVISSKDISRDILIKFTLVIGICFSIPLLLFGFTDTGLFLLNNLLGENYVLAGASLFVIKICFLLPLLTSLQNTYQGFLIISGKHWWINSATIVNVVISLLVAMLLISFRFSGEISAAIATLLGLAVEVLILTVVTKRQNSLRILSL